MVLPSMPVYPPMWCVDCEQVRQLPTAVCLKEHTFRTVECEVSKEAANFAAASNTVADALRNAQESLQTLRAWARGAETRQEIGALRRRSASLAQVRHALMQFVEDCPSTDLASTSEEQLPEEEMLVEAEGVLPTLQIVKEETDDQAGAGIATDVSGTNADDSRDINMDVSHADVKQEGEEREDDSSSSSVAGAGDPAVKAFFLPDERLDVTKETQLDVLPDALKDLQSPSLDKVKRLNGVNCVKHPSWCTALLRRVAPVVEWLYVFEALDEHLLVIRDMPALRFLHVHVCHLTGEPPALPDQLEELAVENVTPHYLAMLPRMRHLRKLSLDWSDDPIIVTFPPLPLGTRGLEWLWVALQPCSTMLSLAKAHAATLQELRVLCASEGDPVWFFPELAADLERCGLVALRRAVLLRWPAPDFPDNMLPHSKKSCQQQRKDLGRLRARSRHSACRTRAVKVFCAECNKNTPEFPDLGDLTWKT